MQINFQNYQNILPEMIHYISALAVCARARLKKNMKIIKLNVSGIWTFLRLLQVSQ